MSASSNSTSDSTSRTKPPEEPADLSLNQDEVLDLGLALGALGGLRHTTACDAAERSTRRFDDRNHRLHESRMKHLGMEGEEKELKADDVGHQVLIRSPVIHNHYVDRTPTTPPSTTPPTAPPTTPPTTPPPTPPVTSPPTNGWLPLAAGLLIGGIVVGGTTYYVNKPTSTTTINKGEKTGIKTVPPAPPYKAK